MQIPFINFNAQYSSIKNVIDTNLLSVLSNFDLINGKEVSNFQQQFSTLLNARHCITTASGTDALFITLKNLGMKPGDEVITPAFSWISSSETISLCGATPVFVDVDPRSYTIDPLQIEAKITTKTRAVVVVHLYGQAAHITEIKSICEAHNLHLIEDCAQAHLTQENGKCVGTFGDAGAFSFYPTKNLGAYGDAGCIVTNNNTLAERIRRFANHGALKKDDHLMEGLNSRMDTLQAAVLLAKLPHLQAWNMKRLQNANSYHALLKEQPNVIVPYSRPNTTHTFHIYAIQAKRRDQLKEYLEEKGVQTLIHYPVALSNLQAYKYLNLNYNDFPVSNTLQENILSLPIYPELGNGEITYVCEKIKEFYKK